MRAILLLLVTLCACTRPDSEKPDEDRIYEEMRTATFREIGTGQAMVAAARVAHQDDQAAQNLARVQLWRDVLQVLPQVRSPALYGRAQAALQPAPAQPTPAVPARPAAAPTQQGPAAVPPPSPAGK